MLLCNSASAYLLSALLLTSYFSICGGSLTESVKASRDENTTYPETTIPQGTVLGINMLTRYNRTISGFIGIPYAEPPVDDLRFKAPVPPDAWNGALNATTETVACPQLDGRGQISGDKDCLYLNLFTPQLPAGDNSTLLPVMLFTIDGQFRTENNSFVRYGRYFLLEEVVVFVIPNFRVGVLGFLSTGDEVAPGNYLRAEGHVAGSGMGSRKHPSFKFKFGGSPNAVTLFGASSGGMSVHLLALSNLTGGEISKTFRQSLS